MRVPTIYVLSEIMKKLKKFHLKMNIFTAGKYCYILHGCVCVMHQNILNSSQIRKQPRKGGDTISPNLCLWGYFSMPKDS